METYSNYLISSGSIRNIEQFVYKELFVTKFKDFVKGLVVVFLSSLKVCTNNIYSMYLLSELDIEDALLQC